MQLLHFYVISSLLALKTLAAIGLTAQPFQLSGKTNLDNIKLSWTLATGATAYDVERRSGSGSYSTIATVPGNTYDDYTVAAGQYTYKVVASAGSTDASNEVAATSGPVGSGTYQSFDNTQASSLKIKSRLKSGSTYYNYLYQTDTDGFKQIAEQTSTNGLDFTGERAVLSRADVCAGTADGFCKLEAISFVQNSKTGEVVMWAHWENRQDYTQARVAVAFGQPGGAFTFGGSFRPTGADSRDLSFFEDTDGSGYLVSATNTNSDLNLHALTPDWHNVTSKVATLLAGQHREAPSLVRSGDYYYLFSSTAAGWYPSIGQYISTTSLSGTWSDSRNIGNTATFGAQSGGVSKIGSTYVMRANRWAAQWKAPEATNRQIVLPISFENGYADYHFYKTVQYLDDDSTGGVYGVQNGKVVSVGKTATGDGTNAAYAVDGTETDPANIFAPGAVPFTYEVDLGSALKISQIDLTTKLVGGSETCYGYVVEGSSDKSTYATIVDEVRNTVVGFVTDSVTDTGSWRYVRISVHNVTNVQNGNEADWAAGVEEFMVYSSS